VNTHNQNFVTDIVVPAPLPAIAATHNDDYDEDVMRMIRMRNTKTCS
jgi:hypothetical protein